MNIKEYVGRRIKYYRNKNKMTQGQLGDKLGVAQSTIAGYEKGELELSYDSIFKIAELFDISINDLFPPTKVDSEEIDKKTANLPEKSDLELTDMAVINKIIEKALTLKGEKKEKLFSSIDITVDDFEKLD